MNVIAKKKFWHVQLLSLLVILFTYLNICQLM